MSTLATKPTREMYEAAFAAASQLQYPSVDEFEQRCGFAVESARLLKAAAVLACPVKVNQPHWQHGRVIYAVTRKYLAEHSEPRCVRTLDIGTAKGFSALCIRWAVEDAWRGSESFSVDVISPLARIIRNTVAEVDGLKTLAEITEPFPEAECIQFVQSTGVHWLEAHPERIHVAFVDGKHTGEVVRQEVKLLAQRQERGDLAIFDDCQIPGVSVAVASLQEWYRIEYLEAVPRQYAIARRR